MTASFLRLDLRRLILFLAVVSAVSTLLNTFYASYHVQRELLIQGTLEANRVYATKLASSIEGFFRTAQQQLAYSAGLLAESFTDVKLLEKEIQRLRLQTESFNAVFLIEAGGRLKAQFPANTGSGVPMEPGYAFALEVRKPLISEAYPVGQDFMLYLAYPVVRADGVYLGYLAGVIYLERHNILNALVAEHYYRDGSYLYVVDQKGRILHHVDPGWVGNVVQGNLAIDAVTQGKSGSTRLINSRGIDMLAGYAPVALAGWGVVAQRPTQATLAELDGLMLAILQHSLPWGIVGLACIYILARLIAQPLWQLARGVRHMDADDAAEHIRKVPTWYFETTQLKRAVLSGLGALHQRIGTLNRDVLTDPLTGLYNRRGMAATLDAWCAREQVFAIVALDIDHFKSINDVYGHDVGDQVIKFLAGMMRENSRSVDILCRSGGEEFLMLLPGVCLEDARLVAERLRLRLQLAEVPGVDRSVTVSLGVAQWRPIPGYRVEQALRLADQALYAAKQQGRNRVMTARWRVGETVECE